MGLEVALGGLLGQRYQRAYGDACAALGRVAVGLALVERRTGNVQVSPRPSVGDELAQEQTSRKHAAPTLADVGDVRDLGVEALTQVLGKRHLPEHLACALGGACDLCAELV